MACTEDTKIIFWGTSEFAIPAFESLIACGYFVHAVVTNPDAQAGRKRHSTPPPIKAVTEKYGISVFQPQKLDMGRIKAEIPDSDLFVVAAYGKIIPKNILEMPKFGALNVHPSLLPRWRGPSPVQQTILSGDSKTGVTIIAMDEKMDHGPILAKREL